MRRILPVVLTALLTVGFLLAGPPAIGGPPAAAQPPAPASTFTPVAPVRVLDTRTGTSPVGPGQIITLNLTRQVPATTTAVVLNVTGVSPTAPTYVTVFPAGGAPPTASSLNLPAGDTRANQVTVTLGTNRSVNLYNFTGDIHLLADLDGYYTSATTGARFTALPPARMIDTRTNNSALGPGSSRTVDLTGRIPVSATAVTFNLTATNPTASTFVTAWPADTHRPNVSNLNLPAGDTRPNQVTVAVGRDRKISLYNNSGHVDVTVDLAGFYTPRYGAAFLPREPKRLLDTRNGMNPVGPGGFDTLGLDGEIPLTSTGVLINLTGVDATAETYVIAKDPMTNAPNASTLNVPPGRAVANAAVVELSTVRAVELYNVYGSIHLVADLAGAFVAVDPTPCTSDCVYSWGGNYGRQLGTGEVTFNSRTPTLVLTLSGVRAVAGSDAAAYALRADGTVWAWGDNQYGQLGNGWVAAQGGSAVPVPVVGLTGVTAIAGGGHGGYALRADRTVWAWGANGAGQLGNGRLDDSSVPVQVTGLTDIVAIASNIDNLTAYALRADGTVWAWGHNGSGQLGNGSDVHYSTVPVQVSGLTGVTAITAGINGGYALRADGTVWAWGYNQFGELGNGQPCPTSEPCLSRVPVQVSNLTDVTAIAGSGANGYAVRDDSTVWSWGPNVNGALGNGQVCVPLEPCESRVPVPVSRLTGVTQITGFASGGYALRTDGTVWAWGDDGVGELGNDTVNWYSTVPVPVKGLPQVSAISGGLVCGYAIVPHP